MKDEELVSPEPDVVRKRIENVKWEPMRALLMTAYVCGAARIGELCGRLNPLDCQQDWLPKRKPIVWGPKGTDASLGEYQVQTLDWANAVEVLKGRMDVADAFPKLKVALFRIKIEKHRTDPQEPVHSRLVALPMDKKYEPWTEEIYNWFKQAGDDYVFPYTRQQAWWYITHTYPTFEGLSYPVEKYYVNREGEVKKTAVYPHLHRNQRGKLSFKYHGLRHVRTKELFETYQFDGLDYIAYVGWSFRQAKRQGEEIPAMLPRYATLYENWKRYLPKLLIRRS